MTKPPFEEIEGLHLLDETLDRVFEESSDGYIESPTGCEAIAACEVIARMKGSGSPGTAYGEAADKWIAEHGKQPSQAILEKANRALDLVTADNSELYESWAESDLFEEWQASVTDLRQRMNS